MVVNKKLEIKIEGTAEKFKNAIKDSEQAIDKLKLKTDFLNTTIKKITSTAVTLGKTLAVGITASAIAVGYGFLNAVKSASSWEEGMVKIEKTTGMTGKELEKLEKDLINMYKTMPMTHEGLLDTVAAAGQLGIKGKENIKKFTDTVVKMSVATDLSTSEASTALAKISQALGEPVSKVKTIADAINELENNTSATSREILNFSMGLSGMAKQTGTSKEQVMALGATLISSGMDAHDAATRVASAFTEISDPTKQKKMAMQMGIPFDELKNKLDRDLVGAIFDYIKHIKKIESPTERTAKITEVFGIVGTKAINSLSNALPSYFKNLQIVNKAIKEGVSLNREYEAASRTFNAKMQILKNSINAIAIDIGNVFIPELNKIIDWLRDNADYIKNTFATIIGIDKSKLTGFGDLVVSTFEKIKTWLSATNETGKTNLQTLTEAFAKFKQVLKDLSTITFKGLEDFIKIIGGKPGSSAVTNLNSLASALERYTSVAAGREKPETLTEKIVKKVGEHPLETIGGLIGLYLLGKSRLVRRKTLEIAKRIPSIAKKIPFKKAEEAGKKTTEKIAEVMKGEIKELPIKKTVIRAEEIAVEKTVTPTGKLFAESAVGKLFKFIPFVGAGLQIITTAEVSGKMPWEEAYPKLSSEEAYKKWREKHPVVTTPLKIETPKPTTEKLVEKTIIEKPRVVSEKPLLKTETPKPTTEKLVEKTIIEKPFAESVIDKLLKIIPFFDTQKQKKTTAMEEIYKKREEEAFKTKILKHPIEKTQSIIQKTLPITSNINNNITIILSKEDIETIFSDGVLNIAENHIIRSTGVIR